MALVFNDKTIKFHVRPGGSAYRQVPMLGLFDGNAERTKIGGRVKLDTAKPWSLRMRVAEKAILLDARQEGGKWLNYHSMPYSGDLGEPLAIRIGKMDVRGEDSDHTDAGDLARLRIMEFTAWSDLDLSGLEAAGKKLKAIQAIGVSVHYELYDGKASRHSRIRRHSRSPSRWS